MNIFPRPPPSPKPPNQHHPYPTQSSVRDVTTLFPTASCLKLTGKQKVFDFAKSVKQEKRKKTKQESIKKTQEKQMKYFFFLYLKKNILGTACCRLRCPRKVYAALGTARTSTHPKDLQVSINLTPVYARHIVTTYTSDYRRLSCIQM